MERSRCIHLPPRPQRMNDRSARCLVALHTVKAVLKVAGCLVQWYSYFMHEYQGQAFADASDLPRTWCSMCTRVNNRMQNGNGTADVEFFLTSTVCIHVHVYTCTYAVTMTTSPVLTYPPVLADKPRVQDEHTAKTPLDVQH